MERKNIKGGKNKMEYFGILYCLKWKILYNILILSEKEILEKGGYIDA